MKPGPAKTLPPAAMTTLSRSVALVIALTLAGCGGPTAPSEQVDRIALYSGQWRGVIGDVVVVLQIQAVAGYRAPALDGTGTAVNRTTGDTHKLKIFGSGSMTDDCGTCSMFNIRLDQGGLGPHARIGQFFGQLSQRTRSWSGHYRASSFDPDFVDVFGVDNVPVTFTKD